MAELSRKAEEKRDGSFQGWAYLTREVARRGGRQVIAKPLPENPYHEEIHLPSELVDNRDALKHHASELADNTRWCDGC